jgi:hypothetical protein
MLKFRKIIALNFVDTYAHRLQPCSTVALSFHILLRLKNYSVFSLYYCRFTVDQHTSARTHTYLDSWLRWNKRHVKGVLQSTTQVKLSNSNLVK